MKRFPQLLGIGLDESTGILVRKSKAVVLGDNAVFFLDPDADAESRLEAGKFITWQLARSSSQTNEAVDNSTSDVHAKQHRPLMLVGLAENLERHDTAG